MPTDQKGFALIPVAVGVVVLLILAAVLQNLDPFNLYKSACEVSESKPNDKDKTLKLITKTISENIADFPRI